MRKQKSKNNVEGMEKNGKKQQKQKEDNIEKRNEKTFVRKKEDDIKTQVILEEKMI